MPRPRKTYPALKVLVPLAILLGVAGVVLFLRDGSAATLLWMLGGAVVLAFLGLLFPRRAEPAGEAQLDLSGQSRAQLEEALAALDAAKGRGEITAERHAAAGSRLRAELQRR